MEVTKHETQGADISAMARSIFEKAKEIKRTHPDVTRSIDRLEREIRQCLEQIKTHVAKLDRHDRDLVTVLVINGLHRTADEVLIDGH